MGRTTKWIMGIIALLFAAWTALWFWGRGEIRASLDTQIDEWRQQGVFASYQGLEIGGFPFAYRGRIVEPASIGTIQTAQGQARTDWQAEWIDFDSSLGDLGVVNFKLPKVQKARITPEGAAPIDLTIRSDKMDGQAVRETDTVRVLGRGGNVAVEAVQSAGAPLSLQIDSFLARAAAPVNRAGQIEGSVRLSEATANAAVWSLLDPFAGFPRRPFSLSADVSADVVAQEDGRAAISAVTLKSLDAEVAGLSLAGEGQASLAGGTPDGEVTLNFAGLGGFIANAAKGGFLPESQAGLYRSMLGNFARPGEDGRQQFNVAFRKGYIFVNGLPTFIPVPRLQ